MIEIILEKLFIWKKFICSCIFNFIFVGLGWEDNKLGGCVFLFIVIVNERYIFRFIFFVFVGEFIGFFIISICFMYLYN